MKKRKFKKIVFVTLQVLVVVGLCFSTGFYYKKYTDLKKQSLSADERIVNYEKEINKTYALPTDEKASLVDIKNADDFKKDEANKEFFANTVNGDVVLIYQKNKLGILYRPSTKKIIKTGPIAFKTQITTAIVGNKSDRDVVITVLKEAFASDIATASEVDAALPLEAGKTVIVDLKGDNKELVEKLAAELKGVVGNVPEGQDRPAETFSIAIYAAPAATTP